MKHEAPDKAVMASDALERLDQMPWSRFHTTLTLALGVGWALDSFETNIIGSVLGILKDHWHLSAAQGGWVVSTWVGGMMVGALLFGYLADRFGRKRLFLATLLWYALFSVLTVFSWNFESFLVFRALTALAVGGEYAAVTAAMGEFIPRKHRGKTDSLILSGFPLGALASAGVAYAVLQTLPADIAWRVGFGLGTTMAIAFFWIRKVIPESPRWLIQQGRIAEAEAIVDRIASFARLEDKEAAARRWPPVAVTVMPITIALTVRTLIKPYGGRLLLASALNFSQAAVVYGVISLMSLVILPYMQVPAIDLPLYYAAGNAAALLGGLTAALLVDVWGRRASLLASYSFTMAAAVFLYAADSLPAMVAGYCLVQFGVTWAYISAYVISAEILPTHIRATGLGASVALGRLGAVLAPPLLTGAFAAYHHPSAALLVLLLLAAPGPIAAAFWWVRGRETRGLSLEAGSLTGTPDPVTTHADIFHPTANPHSSWSEVKP